eukprot:5459637-Pleurochrysis_carterae.AAC.3
MHEELLPDVAHDIPIANELRISNLGKVGAVTSDICHAAVNVKRQLKSVVQAPVEAKAGAEWAALSSEAKEARAIVCWRWMLLKPLLQRLARWLNGGAVGAPTRGV